MTAAPVKKRRGRASTGHQTGTFERRQEGEESTGACEECQNGGRKSASGAEVEPECFYFLPLAAGGCDFQAYRPELRRFPDSRKLAARTGLFQPDKSGYCKQGADATAGPLTEHACQSRPVKRSRNSGALFNTAALFTCAHVNPAVVCGL